MPLVNYGIEMPCYSTEELTSLIKHMEEIRGLPLPLWPGQHPSVRLQYIKEMEQQSTPQSTLPAPHEAQKEEEKEKKQPLYQATVEDITETTAESNLEGVPGNTSLLPTIPCLRTAPACRDPAAYPSAFLASFFGSSLATFLASSFTSFFGNFLASLLGYIRCMEGIEATGQG